MTIAKNESEEQRAARLARGREYGRNYYARNKSYWRNWQALNREKVRESTRANNRRREAALYNTVSTDEPATREYAEIVRNDPCSYCGGPAGEADHIESLARGGADDWDNLTGACKSCNSSKGDKGLLLSLAAYFPATK